MPRIKLFDETTYPSELIELGNFFQKNIHTYSLHNINRELQLATFYTDCQFYDIVSTVHNIIKDYEITGYHFTRLSNKETIEKNGLTFPNNKYIDTIITTLKQYNFTDDIINTIAKNLRDIRNKKYENIDYHIHFIYNIDDYKDYYRYCTVYGGELMADVLYILKNQQPILECQKIADVGKPYIIEFALPFHDFPLINQKTIPSYIVERWIQSYTKSDDDTIPNKEESINFEISPDKIITIHNVTDLNEEPKYW